MDLFLGLWPRQYIPSQDAKIDLDELVAATRLRMLRFEGPLVPIHARPAEEYLMQIANTIRHMRTKFPIDAEQATQYVNIDDAHLHNLRAWVYQRSAYEARALLTAWVQAAGGAYNIENIEHVMVFVCAVRAEACRLQTVHHPDRLWYAKVVMGCVSWLDSEAPRPVPAPGMLQAAWQDDARCWKKSSPWHQLARWAAKNLPHNPA